MKKETLLPRKSLFALTVLAVICIAFIRLSAAPSSRTTLPGSVVSNAQKKWRKMLAGKSKI